MSRISPPPSNRPKPVPAGAAPSTQPRKVRLLFVCIGNACRSPMAEGLARKYGSDVVLAQSAGLAPAWTTPELTVKVMKDRGVDIASHRPKTLGEVSPPFDLVLNLSGERLPPPFHLKSRDWVVKDPFTQPEESYVQCAVTIETLVMNLLLEIRSGRFRT